MHIYLCSISNKRLINNGGAEDVAVIQAMGSGGAAATRVGIGEADSCRAAVWLEAE